MISPGEAAAIAAELAMPDLDQIKQAEQGVRDRRGRFARGRSGNPAGPAARLVVHTFVRAIETSDFDRRLQLVEDSFKARPAASAASRWPGQHST